MTETEQDRAEAQAAFEDTTADLLAARRALAASQADLTRVEAERDHARDELTSVRGTVVDLLYILDAFQIESGADRNASYKKGIAAVRLTRTELVSARTELEQLRADAGELLDEYQGWHCTTCGATVAGVLVEPTHQHPTTTVRIAITLPKEGTTP